MNWGAFALCSAGLLRELRKAASPEASPTDPSVSNPLGCVLFIPSSATLRSDCPEPTEPTVLLTRAPGNHVRALALELAITADRVGLPRSSLRECNAYGMLCVETFEGQPREAFLNLVPQLVSSKSLQP